MYLISQPNDGIGREYKQDKNKEKQFVSKYIEYPPA